MRRPRVVVCGTKFGRVYLGAFDDPGFGYELAGIVGRGSERSLACAAARGVPLFTGVEDLPDDVDLACVVVGGALNGGPGAELARALLRRGVHVLQEHPLHHDELLGCLQEAHRAQRAYHLNTHHVHAAPVRRFLHLARALVARQRPLYVDAAGAFQVLYSLVDVVAQAVGDVRPWRFEAADGVAGSPFRTVLGTIGGVPLTLRLQQQVDPREPDNFAHLWHRISVGTEGGHLTLVSTHGPVVWCPRPHMPGDLAGTARIDGSGAPHLDVPAATVVGPPSAPSTRDVLGGLWPAAVRRAISELDEAARQGEDPRRRGQYHLALCQVVEDIGAACGPVELIAGRAPEVLSVDDLGALPGELLTDGAAPAMAGAAS